MSPESSRVFPQKQLQQSHWVDEHGKQIYYVDDLSGLRYE
jgi:hypothetical protein